MGTSRSSGVRGLPSLAAAAGLALVPWAFLPLLRDALLLPKLLVLTAVVAAGLAAWAAAGAPSLATGLEAPLCAFAAAAVLAAAGSIDPASSLFGPDLVPEVSLAALGLVVASLYLGVAAARLDSSAPPRLAAVLCAAGLPMTLLACVQAWAPMPADFLFAGPLGRAMGTFGHPVALAGYFAVAMPVALWLAVERRSAFWGGACAAFLVGLAAAASRGALLGAAAGCAWVLYAQGAAGAGRRVFVLVVLAVVAAGLMSVSEKTAGFRPGARLGGLAISMRAVQEHPLSGWGPGTFGILYRMRRTASDAAQEGFGVVMPHAHNDWAEAAVGTGLLGFSAYLWLNIALAARLRRLAPAAGALVALFVFSKLNLPVLPVMALAAILLGAALGAQEPGPGKASALLAGLLGLGALSWGGWAVLGRIPADRASLLGREARSEGRAQDAALHFERAVAAAPDVLAFRLDLVNLLWDASDSVTGASREYILTRARDAALEGVRRRPAEGEFLRLLGLAELRRARAGAPSMEQAGAALEAARKLDPLNPGIAEAISSLSTEGPQRR